MCSLHVHVVSWCVNLSCPVAFEVNCFVGCIHRYRVRVQTAMNDTLADTRIGNEDGTNRDTSKKWQHNETHMIDRSIGGRTDTMEEDGTRHVTSRPRSSSTYASGSILLVRATCSFAHNMEEMASNMIDQQLDIKSAAQPRTGQDRTR